MPIACDGRNLWNGNRKPVTLVATVVQMNTPVQPWSCLALSSPNITTKPAMIPTKLNKTCTKVSIVIPKIIGCLPFTQSFFGLPGDRYDTRVPPGMQSDVESLRL